jgi:DNA (cytosine-5)-methyltransferase 1
MDLGFTQAGFEHAFFAEIDEYSREVLMQRWPGVDVYTDVKYVKKHIGACDVLIGGFPCQDVSLAGKRAGLAGERSGLFWEFLRIADDIRPAALVFENVVGLFSSGSPKGSDFGAILDALSERGYVVTWRTLDASDFGVPQRRRRVFIVAIRDSHPGAERIGEVLALTQGSEGDPCPSNQARTDTPARTAQRTTGTVGVSVLKNPDIAGTLMSTTKQGGWRSTDISAAYVLSYPEVAGTLTKRYAKGVNSTMDDGAIVYRKQRRAKNADDFETWVDDGKTNTLNCFDNGNVRTTHVVIEPPLVRRLSVIECERLMGWPDNHTLVTYKNKPASDTKRFAACGNGVVAPVAEWIATRLKEVLA